MKNLGNMLKQAQPAVACRDAAAEATEVEGAAAAAW